MWNKIVIAVCLDILVAACGSANSSLAVPSPVPWDSFEDTHSTPDLAKVFQKFWEDTGGGDHQVILAKGMATVTCGFGQHAGLDAMAACKRNLTCFNQGIEHTRQLFYSGGLFPKKDEEPQERKVCAQCTCPGYHE